MNFARATFLVFIIVIAGSACSFERKSSLDANPTQPTSSSGGGGSGPSLAGTWASPEEVPFIDPKTCNFFQWKVSSQTATTMGGTFTAVCMTNVAIAGTANGTLTSPTTVTLAASGTANLPSAPGCTCTLEGQGTVEENGNALGRVRRL